VRLGSTIVLIGTFAGIIYCGHVPLAAMILGIQIAMVRELYALADTSPTFGGPASRASAALRWYTFAVAAFWIYTRFCRRQLAVEAVSLLSGGQPADTAAAADNRGAVAGLLSWLVRRHNLTAFMLYTAGLVTFVLGLDRGRAALAPFRSFAWAHLTILFVVLPSSFFVSNLFEGGIIWVLLPASLVIVNDIAAYVAGFFCGRTPLIAVSPKKTWEGFVGGALGTVAASWALAELMSRSPWLTCPRTDLSLAALACDPGPVYAPRLFSLADALPDGAAGGAYGPGLADLAARLAPLTFTARPMQLHAVALAAFASLLAPFGGFFASGLKRAFKVKDFGDSIPGHGGMTDRMDCQVVMAVFSSLYLHAFVSGGPGGRGGGGGPGSVAALAAAASALGSRDQLALLAALARGVAGAHLLPPGVPLAAVADAADAAAAGADGVAGLVEE
jgi:phosphatidate cytidylyltransferase